MPYIESAEKLPIIKMKRNIYDQMRAIASNQKDGCITMFLKAVEDSGFSIEEVYVPKQYVNTSYSIVDQEELLLLGDQYNAVVRVVGSSNSTVKSDDSLFAKMFYGVDTYIFGKMLTSGEVKFDIRQDNLFIRECNVKIIDPIPKEVVEAAKKIMWGKVVPWEFKYGYTQDQRPFYRTPKIIAENLTWKDVVGGGGDQNA